MVLIKLILFCSAVFAHVCLCIFLYENYGIFPLIAYILSIGTIVLLIIPFTTVSFRRIVRDNLRYHRNPMALLHKRGENYSRKVKNLFLLCNVIVYVCLGILYLLIENKCWATILCLVLYFIVIKILARLFDKYATFYLK